MDALRPILKALGYGDDLRQLEAFKERFEEYRRLDDEILPLAVENTNLKAQRLSFGPAREAADSFHSAVDSAVRSVPAKDSSRARELAATARAAVLEILALQAPHIAEPRDDVMTRLEEQMKTSAANARKTLTALQAASGHAGASQVAAARRHWIASYRPTIRSSRSRGGTPTCARWRCRWAGSVRSPRNAKIS